MYPLDFEEFLLALNHDMWIDEIKKAFKEKRPTPIHEELLKLYRTYLCIGGMPESIKEYIRKESDIFKYNKNILKTIRTAYLADMTKYVISLPESVKIENTYLSIPSILGNENNKFKYSEIQKGANKRDYETAIDWLVSSKMVYKVNQINKVEIPLKAYENRDSFKLYINDVGILTSMLDLEFNSILLDEEFMYKGALVENYIAQVLATKGYNIYYWSSGNKAEIDFVISTKDRNNTYRSKVRNTY